jgi:hypothetical protein
MSVSVRITEFRGNSIAVTVKFILKYRIHKLNNHCQNHQHIGIQNIENIGTLYLIL